MYWTVAVSCVLGAFRAGPTEQGLVNLTEEAFGFLVCHTDLLFRAVVMVSSGLSGKGSQPLEDNIGLEIGPVCYSPALRAAPWRLAFFPAKAETGTAEAVPTVYGDGVQEAVHADGAGEFTLEGLQCV